MATQDQIWDKVEQDVAKLVRDLIPTIEDEYRATDDPEDDTPGMSLTIGADLDGSWGYQTGDNSFAGGAYGFPHWGCAAIYRDSDPRDVARQIVDEIAECII